MNKQKCQSGFAHIAIVAVILVLSIAGALGYVYYQNVIRNKSNVTSKTSSSSKNKNDETNNSTASNDSDIPVNETTPPNEHTDDIDDQNALIRDVTISTYDQGNLDIGISFSLPSDWYVNGSIPYGRIYKSPDYSDMSGSSLQVLYCDTSLSDSEDDLMSLATSKTCYANYSEATNIIKEFVEVDGIRAIKFYINDSESSQDENKSKKLLFVSNGHEYVITQLFKVTSEVNNPYPTLIDDIISSLKFDK